MTTDTLPLPLTLDKRGLAQQFSLSKRSIDRLCAGATFPRPLPGFKRPRWSTMVVLEWLRANGGSSNSEGK